MVTAASGAGRAGRLAGLGKEPRAAPTWPACRREIRSPSAQAPVPISSLGGISLGRRSASRKGSSGAGCSGGRDNARGRAGEGCGAPKQPDGITRNLQGAPGAARGSPPTPPGIPCLQEQHRGCPSGTLPAIAWHAGLRGGWILFPLFAARSTGGKLLPPPAPVPLLYI